MRGIILSDQYSLTPFEETMLFEASRSSLVRERIKPFLDSGRIVILDRFIDSTLAYQPAQGIEEELIKRLSDLATLGTLPDITILLYVDCDIGLERKKDGGYDRIEKKGVEYHRKVWENYLAIQNSDPDRVKLVDSSKGIEEVDIAIYRLVEPVLKAIKAARSPQR